MNKKMIIILGIIVVIAAVFAAFVLFSSAEDTGLSQLNILGNGTIGENGTLSVKLSNGDGIALKDKKVHVVIKNAKGKTVFDKTSKTSVNGVAYVKLDNVGAGKYDVNVTFDGDENYTSCSVAEKLVIAEGVVEEDTNNDTADTTTVEDTSSTPVQSSPSQSQSQPSHSTPSSNTPSDEGSEDTYYDEDGNEMEPVIDENGNPSYEIDEEE